MTAVYRIISERTYCGDFVFDGDSLLYANFAGGYFDGAGHPHYRHADFQGNIAMVTDATGQIEQHTGYYPYGEPWREPDGQPYLYGGKERMRDHALNEYDFGPRRLSSALCLWTAPDPLATDYAGVNPYSYCAANPIKYTDPTGCIIEDPDSLVARYEQSLQNMKNAAVNSKLSDENKEKVKKYVKTIQGKIDALKKSDQVYSFKKDSELGEKDSGYTKLDTQSNKVICGVPTTDTGELVAHELTHASQYESGDLSFGYDGNGGMLYDATDETEAYNNQRIFVFGVSAIITPTALQSDCQPGQITTEMVRKIIDHENKQIYKDLPLLRMSLSNAFETFMNYKNQNSWPRPHYFKKKQ